MALLAGACLSKQTKSNERRESFLGVFFYDKEPHVSVPPSFSSAERVCLAFLLEQCVGQFFDKTFVTAVSLLYT